MESVLLSLSSGGIGAVAAVIISIFYYRRYENRRWKLDTLKRLAAHRYAITESLPPEGRAEFFAALNEVFVVFHDAPEVLAALETMHRELNSPEDRLSDNLMRLFKVMCDDLGIDYRALNDSFFLRPFTPGGGRVTLENPQNPELPR